MKAGLVTLARIIGRRFGVNVVVDPNVGTAATDGRTIWIPPVDLSSQEDVEMVEGLVDHEAMHCRLTDFEVNGNDELEQSFSNIFEDIWGELDFAAIYPGTRRTIKRAAEIMTKRGVIGAKLGENAHPAEMAGQMLVNGLRSRVLGQDVLEEAFLHNQALFRTAVGEPLADRVWEVSQKVRDIHSTAEALALAREVIALIKQEQEQQQNQQQEQQAGGDSQDDSQSEQDESKADGSGQSGDESPDSDGNGGDQDQDNGESKSQGGGNGESDSEQTEGGASGGCSKGESGKQQKGQSEPSGETNGSSSNAGAEGDQFGGAGAGRGQPGKVDPEKLAKTLQAIQELLDARKDDFGKIDLAEIMEKGMPLSKSIDFSKPTVEVPRRVQGWDASIESTVRTLRNTLSARLAHLFNTQEETKVWLDKSGRRLSAGALAAVQTGQQHVFRKMEYGDEVSVEVSLVIDCSSSMDHPLSATATRLQAAQSVALALGDVLEQHDIPFSVTLFARSICAYKVTDQSWKAARLNIAGLRESGSTNTAAAVLEASKDIIFSERDRRLMLVVTDGIPNDVQFAVSESAEIQKSGVEVRYIMIGGDHGALSKELSSVGIAFSVANSPEVLAKAVFEAVEPRLALRNAA